MSTRKPPHSLAHLILIQRFITLPTVPVSALLLFGTQTVCMSLCPLGITAFLKKNLDVLLMIIQDLFNAWAFWRKPATRRTPTPSLQSVDSLKMKSIKELEASASTPFTDSGESYTDPWSPTPPYTPTKP